MTKRLFCHLKMVVTAEVEDIDHISLATGMMICYPLSEKPDGKTYYHPCFTQTIENQAAVRNGCAVAGL